jgi:hypothetical protein
MCSTRKVITALMVYGREGQTLLTLQRHFG